MASSGCAACMMCMQQKIMASPFMNYRWHFFMVSPFFRNKIILDPKQFCKFLANHHGHHPMCFTLFCALLFSCPLPSHFTTKRHKSFFALTLINGLDASVSNEVRAYFLQAIIRWDATIERACIKRSFFHPLIFIINGLKVTTNSRFFSRQASRIVL